MQLALIGLPSTGVRTVFSAITGLAEPAGAYSGGAALHRVVVLKVPDERLELVGKIFQPKKVTPATVEIAEFPGLFGQRTDSEMLGKARQADALAIVLRSFSSSRVPHVDGSVDPVRDLDRLLTELMLADLSIVETRLKRLQSSLKKRKDEEEEAEKRILEICREYLDQGRPLRDLELPDIDRKRIRGFGFLTRKPVIVLLNIGEDQLGNEVELLVPFQDRGFETRALCADIEAELARLSPEERLEFMQEFGIEELAAPVVLSAAYQILDIVTFFTYSEPECRAWTIHRGDTAVDAAAKVHTDLAKGFIRAEVVGFDDFVELGDLKNIKSAGKLRLEGKDYVVHDGDLILVRHS